MALPPKPKVGPLVRRSLFAAALATGGCGGGKPTPVRIGARISAPEQYFDASVEAATDAQFAQPPPIRIGAEEPPPVELDTIDAGVITKPPPPRIGRRPIRIGPPRDPRFNSMIRGTLLDNANAPIANVSVEITIGNQGRVVTTDADGNFELDGYAPGEYAARLSLDGRSSDVTLVADRSQTRQKTTI